MSLIQNDLLFTLLSIYIYRTEQNVPSLQVQINTHNKKCTKKCTKKCNKKLYQEMY